MDAFFNALKAQAGAQDQMIGQARFGVVTSVDPARATARVTLQPEGVLSGWLPVLSPWVGAGWGLSCPPTPGDQVLVIAQEGDGEHGVIVGRAYSETATAPATPVGELWLLHKSGSFVKLSNDGTIRVQGDLHVTGDVISTGQLQDQHGTLAQLRGRYNAHRHASFTAAPNPQD